MAVYQNTKIENEHKRRQSELKTKIQLLCYAGADRFQQLSRTCE